MQHHCAPSHVSSIIAHPLHECSRPRLRVHMQPHDIVHFCICMQRHGNQSPQNGYKQWHPRLGCPALGAFSWGPPVALWRQRQPL
eukprot:1145038-Pelagomonas_calceolata.AAC.2